MKFHASLNSNSDTISNVYYNWYTARARRFLFWKSAFFEKVFNGFPWPSLG